MRTSFLHLLVQGHYEARGEADAIAASSDSSLFATGGDDCTVRVWDSSTFRQKYLHLVSSKVRALAYNPDGSQLACGCFEGTVRILSDDLNDELAAIHLSSHWIQALCYSPDGLTLAAGSHDTKIYLMSTKSYSICHVCSGHHSFIASIDFSIDSKALQSSSGDYELLFWDAGGAKQIKSMAEACNIKWASWTSTIGWPVQVFY